MCASGTTRMCSTVCDSTEGVARDVWLTTQRAYTRAGALLTAQRAAQRAYTMCAVTNRPTYAYTRCHVYG